MIDTGASFVTLSRSFAARLKLDLGSAAPIRLQSVNGPTMGQLVLLSKIAVDGASAARVPAVVVDDLGGFDGLLGMSFLSRFNLTQENGVLTIAARR